MAGIVLSSSPSTMVHGADTKGATSQQEGSGNVAACLERRALCKSPIVAAPMESPRLSCALDLLLLT